MSRIEEIQEEIAKLEAEKEQLEKPPRWRAKKDGEYFYVDDKGYVYTINEWGDSTDEWLYSIGNYFQTKAEALAYKEYLKAKIVIRKDAGGYRFNRNNNNYVGRYYICNHSIGYHFYTDAIYESDAIYFQSEKDIKESQDKHRKEWLAYVTYGLPEEVSNE